MYVLECQELFRAAITQVIKDEGFQLPTDPAKNAVSCAQKVLVWMGTNRDEAMVVARSLVMDVSNCFHESKSPRVARKYYKLRSSKKFKEFWIKFLSDSVGLEACPIFLSVYN